jgi:hypothetical protein
MSTPQPTLTDALLRDALGRRADGPPAAADLIDDVLTVVGATSQERAWGSGVVRVARPMVILVAAALVLAALVGGVLAAGALLRDDPELRGDPATVIAQFAEIHVGWVYVYADGRVVYYPDRRASSFGGSIPYMHNERRLTQAGVDLVRSGMLPASAFLPDPSLIPAQAWADAEAGRYEPATYAICYFLPPLGVLSHPHGALAETEVEVRTALDRLPRPAQSLLRGGERVFDRGMDLAGLLAPPSLSLDRPRCSEVTVDEARMLFGILDDAGWSGELGILSVDADSRWSLKPGELGFRPALEYYPSDWRPADDTLGVGIHPEMVLPHGVIQGWGG